MAVNTYFEPFFDDSRIKKTIEDILACTLNDSIWVFTLKNNAEFTKVIMELLWKKWAEGQLPVTVEEYLSSVKTFLGLSLEKCLENNDETKDKLVAFIGEFLLICARSRYGTKLNSRTAIPYNALHMRTPTDHGMDLLENFEDKKIIIWESKASRVPSTLQDRLREAWSQATKRYVSVITPKLNELGEDENFKLVIQNFRDNINNYSTSNFVWIFTSRTGDFPDVELNISNNSNVRDWMKKVEIVRSGCVFNIDNFAEIIEDILKFLLHIQELDSNLYTSDYNLSDLIKNVMV